MHVDHETMPNPMDGGPASYQDRMSKERLEKRIRSTNRFLDAVNNQFKDNELLINFSSSIESDFSKPNYNTERPIHNSFDIQAVDKYLVKLGLRAESKLQSEPSSSVAGWNVGQIKQVDFAPPTGSNPLTSYLNNPQLSEIEKLNILLKVFQAIQNLHKNQQYHGNINCDNILCTSDGNVGFINRIERDGGEFFPRHKKARLLECQSNDIYFMINAINPLLKDGDKFNTNGTMQHYIDNVQTRLQTLNEQKKEEPIKSRGIFSAIVNFLKKLFKLNKHEKPSAPSIVASNVVTTRQQSSKDKPWYLADRSKARAIINNKIVQTSRDEPKQTDKTEQTKKFR